MTTKFIPNLETVTTKFIPNLETATTKFIPNLEIATTKFIPNLETATTKFIPNLETITTKFIPNLETATTKFIPNLVIIAAGLDINGAYHSITQNMELIRTAICNPTRWQCLAYCSGCTTFNLSPDERTTDR